MGLRQGNPIATSSSLCSSPVSEMSYKQIHVPMFCCKLLQCKRSRVLCCQSSIHVIHVKCVTGRFRFLSTHVIIVQMLFHSTSACVTYVGGHGPRDTPGLNNAVSLSRL